MNTHNLTIQKWLTESCGLSSYTVHAMPGDAGFRRYFRVRDSNQSYVMMDASLEREKCAPFIAISNALRQQGLLSPEIISSDLTQGFLLISDFGDRKLLEELTASNAQFLYSHALDSLAVLQRCPNIADWPLQPFTADFMRQELVLFSEWFLEAYLQLKLSFRTQQLLINFFDFISQQASSQPYVMMHRDYHSANLMVLPENRIGILDFQDAFIGPITYDLVSLLRDCYIDWPETVVTPLVFQYQDQLALTVSRDEFLRWFDLMGLQRHLKALLTFARKYKRDGNANYLQHIPRTLNYVAHTSARYPECKEFRLFLQEVIPLCVP